jgi:alpha-aminoadipate carrier protein LysW
MGPAYFAGLTATTEQDKRERSMAVTCPECDNPLDIDPDEVEEGETITCDECGSEFDIISTEPLQIVPVDAEGYDDEDDGYGREATDDEEE